MSKSSYVFDAMSGVSQRFTGAVEGAHQSAITLWPYRNAETMLKQSSIEEAIQSPYTTLT
jgi:hypothetical protein